MRHALFPSVPRILLALSCVLFLGTAQALAQGPAPAKPQVATAPPGQQAFATQEAAFDAFVDAIRRGGDPAVMRRLFGNNYQDLIWVDPDDIDAARKKFLEAYDKSHKLNTASDGKVSLEVGSEGWTFPIPLVKRADGWRFDIVAGAEEIQDREIGANELAVIQVLLSIVDAQNDYIDADPMKVGTAQYARRLLSSPGKKDGLYWESKPGEPESPLGELIAQAQAAGANKDVGYFGYHYRMLYAQGPNAPGGARDYLVNDRMIGGFAVIAWPVQYADTGVMTFMVGQDGIVYEKDLGPNTTAAAALIKSFNPDKTWQKSDTTP
jgi:hypothetical protein